MTFFDLILRNLWSKKARSVGLAFAVAIAVMAVVTLDVTSSGLEQSAAAIISVGKADFTVAQKGASDTLSSTIDRQELARISHTPGVASAVGVLVETQHLNADNPVFIEIGINPGDLAAFGVKIVSGHPYSPPARTRSCWAGRRLPTSDSMSVTGSTPTGRGTPWSASTRPGTRSGTPGPCSPSRPSRDTTGCPASSPWPS